MTWELSPGASLADLATIELRRITDVLQVDHASLFLRDADDPEQRSRGGRDRAVRRRGAARALHAAHARRPHRARREGRALRGPGRAVRRPGGAARPRGPRLGALLVVTRRANRRLGAIDSEVVREATQTLVERFLAPADRGEPRFVSERAVRSLHRRR